MSRFAAAISSSKSELALGTIRAKTLGKSYRSCRSAPHELTPQQAQRGVDVCRQLIGNPMDDRFIRRIVTCDEKWVYYRNLKPRNSGSVPSTCQVHRKKIGSAR